MKVQLRHHIIQSLGYIPERLDDVLDAFHPRVLGRQDSLLEIGEVCRHVHFVAEGCLQVYVWNTDGQEATRDFVLPQQWCSSLASFRDQRPAMEGIRAIGPSSVLSIAHADFLTLVEQLPVFAERYQHILEEAYLLSTKRVTVLLSLNASQRIEWLHNNQPELARNVSSRLLAGYLGMTKETYSRLRMKIDSSVDVAPVHR
jgi:CRP-like cAMP-binding protein